MKAMKTSHTGVACDDKPQIIKYNIWQVQSSLYFNPKISTL